MIKLFPLLSVLFLIYWGCEEQDTIPTELTLWEIDYSIEETDSLDLSFTGHTGPIPTEIGNLINLTYLDLRGNNFTGEIPPEIGSLTNLEYLLLHSNQLTGKIPKSICDLGINWSDPWYFSTNNNQLCPPYPYCPGDYVVDPNPPNCD